ncbi:MAG: putative Ig domain-containing protein [Propionibacteriales bacterium]|nr:putative Ig domain-containing protein [Propionibacteriales bacterium]
MTHQIIARGIVGILVATGSAVAFSTGAQAAPSEPCSPALAKAAPAADVAATNPKAFRAAEARNAKTVPGLAKKAQSDRSLWLDRCGSAFYVDAGPSAGERSAAVGTMGAATAAAGLPLAGVPLADTFTLESKPGSARTIYLDFNGETVTGTAWNNTYGATITAEPYSIDTTVSTAFSDAELTEIQKAWQTVAEDYAPYDVNVTLKDPGTAAIDRTSSSDLVYGTRAVITNGGVVYDGCGCGGVAYVGVFNTTGSNHMFYQPAWVFSNGTTKNGKYIGEATSHEIGHNFGLNHDGTSTAGYYSGSSPWAPIMGASYSQPISQWSKGQYPDANNTQDDVTQIATGAAYRADEDATGAVALGNGAALNGVVTKETDADSYSFVAAGSTTVTVANGSPFPDLDVQLRVLDANGAQVALVNPTATRVSAVQASGLNASYTFTAPTAGAGFTAEIRGAGQGTVPNAGAYSTYGSLGTYQVSLATQTPTNADPVVVTVGSLPDGTVGTAYAASPVSASGGIAPYSYTATGLPAGLSINSGTGAVSGTPTAPGTYTPAFTVTDALGATGSGAGTVTIAPAPVAVADQSVSATVGTALSRQLVATGGTGSYTWSLSGGSLPPGLGFSAAGVLSGTPTTAGSYSFSATATSGAASDAGTVTVTVAPAPVVFVTGATLPLGKVRSAYSTTISVSGGTPGYTWARTSGSLPAGLSITYSGAVATITGTPSKQGSATFTLRVTDAAGGVATRTFTLQIKR